MSGTYILVIGVILAMGVIGIWLTKKDKRP